MSRFWNRFVLYMEIYSYARVLKECSSMLSDEHKANIYDELMRAKRKAS